MDQKDLKQFATQDSVKFSRILGGVEVPCTFTCHESTTIEEAASWITQSQELLLEKLHKHGAILFRDFPLAGAVDFNCFVEGFLRFEELPYENSLSFAVRLPVVGRVCTTNEGKDGGLTFHHEQAQTPVVPSKLFFFCESTGSSGGATAICPSALIVEKLTETHPQFIKKCEEVGVVYTAHLSYDQDKNLGVGRSWRSFLGVETVSEAEEKMGELGYSWEWVPSSKEEESDKPSLHATSPPLLAIRTAPDTTTKVFFNQVVAQLANANEWHTREGGEGELTQSTLNKFMKFSDGTELDINILNTAKQLCEDHAVNIEWQKGDVVLLDNYLVMHARRPFEGNRRLLASLVK